MNTQKENVKAVVEKGGDYCVALKGNQGNFYTDMQDYFDKDTGEKEIEKRYYISSLLRDIATFSEAIRGHWEVENKLHWQMDYTFKCDKNQTVNKKALFNLQIIKKFALNILNLVKEDYRRSLKKIRFGVSLGAEEEIHNIFYLLHRKKQIFSE